MSEIATISRSLLLPVTQKFRLPQSLIFFVTSRCNARCPFCLYYEQVSNPVAAKEELTVDEVNRIAAHYGTLHYLGISGGEPFVRKDLAELCKAFITHCSASVVDIPSNFWFTEHMLEFAEKLLPQYPDVSFDLQLSLDHLGEKHDELRKVKGLFERAVATFRQLDLLRKKYSNLHLKINIVYLDENKDDLEHIFVQLKKLLSFDRIQLTFPHHLLVAAEPEKLNRLRCDLENYFKLASVADTMQGSVHSNKLYSLGLRSLKKLYRQLLADAVHGRKTTGSYCEAGKQILVINEKGDVFPCEILWNEKTGNLRESDYDIRKILASTQYAQFRKQYLGENKCNCTWSCAMNSEISVNASYFPQLGFHALRLLLQSGR